MFLGGVGYILFIYSHMELGKNGYWRYDFPGFIVGSGSTMAAFLGVNVSEVGGNADARSPS